MPPAQATRAEQLAARRTLLLQHFKQVEAIPRVGIAGGAPSPKKAEARVRLGDTVVSDSRGVTLMATKEESPVFLKETSP